MQQPGQPLGICFLIAKPASTLDLTPGVLVNDGSDRVADRFALLRTLREARAGGENPRARAGRDMALPQEKTPETWECGRRDKATLKKMVERLSQWDATVYCTDKWASYASVILQNKLVQSKATTHDIERNHCRQRHWYGRFKRKSIIISKSLEMVDLTMALFATFRVNGNQDDLLSLLA
jgi:insertion element IS1 protein InsB